MLPQRAPFGVHAPEDAGRNANCDKAFHLEIPSSSFVLSLAFEQIAPSRVRG